MKLVTNIFVVILTILVGGLSTGFTVYQMNCSEACPSGLYLQHPHGQGDACGISEHKGEDDNNVKDEKGCCSKSQEKHDEEKGDCCDVKEVKVFKGFEFVSFISIDLNKQDLEKTFDFIDNQEFNYDKERLISNVSYRGPPDYTSLSGKKIRILISSLQYDDYFLS